MKGTDEIKDLRVSKSGKILEVVAEHKTEIEGILVGYTDYYKGEKQPITGRVGTYAKFAFTGLEQGTFYGK